MVLPLILFLGEDAFLIELLLIMFGGAIGGIIVKLVHEKYSYVWWKYMAYLGSIPFMLLLISIIELLIFVRGEDALETFGRAMLFGVLTAIALALGFLIGLFRLVILNRTNNVASNK